MKDCCTHSLLHAQQDALTQYKDNRNVALNTARKLSGQWIYFPIRLYATYIKYRVTNIPAHREKKKEAVKINHIMTASVPTVNFAV
jgi:hypothetical protein